MIRLVPRPTTLSQRKTAGQKPNPEPGTKNLSREGQNRRSEHLSHCPYYVEGVRGTAHALYESEVPSNVIPINRNAGQHPPTTRHHDDGPDAA